MAVTLDTHDVESGIHPRNKQVNQSIIYDYESIES